MVTSASYILAAYDRRDSRREGWKQVGMFTSEAEDPLEAVRLELFTLSIIRNANNDDMQQMA